jgi:muconate cycloisomerase
MPQWAYETAETVVSTIRRHLAPALLGLAASDRWGLQRRMQEVIGRGPSPGQPIAKAALDIAVHDLCARTAGLPLRCLLGGALERRTVHLSFTVTAHDAAAAAEQVRAARRHGYRHFNFKVAVAPDTDREVAEAVREAGGPDAFCWADANQGCSLPSALRLADGLAEAGINLFEQPFPADRPHLLAQLRGRCRVPLAVDEASVGAADFFTYAREGLVDYLVLKLTRSAGIWPSLQQLAIAEAAGLPFVVSGLTDGLLGRAAACQVAAAYGGEGPAALNGGQFLDETPLYAAARIESGGSVQLPDTAGLGIEPEEELVREVLDPELS